MITNQKGSSLMSPVILTLSPPVTVVQAVKLRDQHYPGIPLVMSEGASYCALAAMRWEERSDAYWEVVEHAAREYREHGLWGAVARTCCGPEDPSWHEFPERLKRVNAVFTGEHE